MRNMFLGEIWSIVRTNQGNAVLIKPRGMDVAVPIFVGTLEMQSILIGQEKVSLPRPMTHDLFLNMLRRVNLTIKRVEVNELKDDIFHARLIITGGEYTSENPLIMDSRPSDAFALVARKHCPIFISQSVVEKAGVPLDFFINALEEDIDGLDAENDKLTSLQKQLERAVDEEEYELAAEIRDKIKILKNEVNPLLHE